MNTRKAAALGTSAVLLIAVVWIIVGRSRYVMPAYKGKTAEEWFYGPKRHPGLQTTIEDARVAFDAMGTNCVPFLLDKAKTRETAFNRFYCWLHAKLPTQMKAKLKPALKATYIQMIAYLHLGGPASKSDFMAAELLASVKQIDDDRVRLTAFQSLEALANRSSAIEEKKAYFLSFLDDSDFQIQLRSAIVLSRTDNKLTNGLPILLKAATNRTFVAQAMPSLAMTPQLIRSVQKSAHEALRMVSPAIAEQLEIQQLYSRPDE